MYERVVVKRVVHGGVNRETFLKFLREDVRPLAQLMRQQLVHRFGERARVALLMDNAAIHKGEEVARCMEQDAYVQFVPPYSPDRNLPIEGLFKDTKSYLKRVHYNDGNPNLSIADIEAAVEHSSGVESVLARFQKAGYRIH